MLNCYSDFENGDQGTDSESVSTAMTDDGHETKVSSSDTKVNLFSKIISLKYLCYIV